MKSLFTLFFVAAMTTGFVSCGQQSAHKKSKPANQKKIFQNTAKPLLLAGCFWHEEALFESIKGVKEAVSGYAGGTAKDPNYEMVETGNTGHAESVMVYYDPSVVSYSTLLKVYFAGQDPTATNGQAPDFGSQYRSIAFYTNNSEKEANRKLHSTIECLRKIQSANCSACNAPDKILAC